MLFEEDYQEGQYFHKIFFNKILSPRISENTPNKKLCSRWSSFTISAALVYC